MPIFNSREVREWEQRVEVELQWSSAYYPESNGRSERNVGVVKQLLTKASAQGECLREALSLFNATPWTPLGVSPSSMVLGRDPRVPRLLGVRDNKDPLLSGQAQWLKENSEKEERNERVVLNSAPLNHKPGLQVMLQCPCSKR